MARFFYALPYHVAADPDWDFQLYIVSPERNAADMVWCWEEVQEAWFAFESTAYAYPSLGKLRPSELELAGHFAQDLCKVIAELWAWNLRRELDHTQLWRNADEKWGLLSFEEYADAEGWKPEYYSVELVLRADSFFPPADIPWRENLHHSVRTVANALAEQEWLHIRGLEDRSALQHHSSPRLKIISSPLVVHPELREGEGDERSRRVLHFYQRQALMLPLQGKSLFSPEEEGQPKIKTKGAGGGPASVDRTTERTWVTFNGDCANCGSHLLGAAGLALCGEHCPRCGWEFDQQATVRDETKTADTEGEDSHE